MLNALFDTNILIDYLGAVPEAKAELGRYSARAISVITWMEVMIGASAKVEASTREFLAGFTRIEIDDAVAMHALNLRQKYKMKLPDAIIWASAQQHAMLLVTRNTKDFPHDEPGIRVPY